jgi:hypothetical protein
VLLGVACKEPHPVRCQDGRTGRVMEAGHGGREGARDMLSCQQDKPDQPEPWEPPPKGPPGTKPVPDGGEEGLDGDVLESDPPPPDTIEPWEPPPRGPVG